MRFSELIVTEMDSILQEFEDFARSHTVAGATMDVAALRDHAESILRAFASDLHTRQTAGEQRRKSEGDAPTLEDAPLTAAQLHGYDRAGSGFSLEEMFAEYRALRASVMRHWVAAQERQEVPGVLDMIRFNEAMDQAVAESISRYAAAVSEYREMFIAVLGHDLRTPLSAVLTASAFLAENAESPRSAQLATSIHRSGERMNHLVADMLDFTLSRLGRGIPIERGPADLRKIARETVDEIRLQHPNRDFRFNAEEPVNGEWDARRVAQVLTNLISNAVQHGARDSAITVVARGEEKEAIVAVRNRGNTIAPADIADIFEPFRRTSSAGDGKTGRSMGLGLYIARQIALAHGGTLDVDSSAERGTTFTLRLPRYPAEG